MSEKESRQNKREGTGQTSRIVNIWKKESGYNDFVMDKLTEKESGRDVKPERIGANIRRIRIKHGETQAQLGEVLGYGSTTIANYESGYRLPDVISFIQIALHYGEPLEEFIREENE